MAETLTETSAAMPPRPIRCPEIKSGDTLGWTSTENGLHYLPGFRVLTDLPPDTFWTGQILGNSKVIEFGINPQKLGSLTQGKYSVKYQNEELILHVVKDPEGKGTFFGTERTQTAMDDPLYQTVAKQVDSEKLAIRNPLEFSHKTELLALSKLSPLVIALYDRVGFKRFFINKNEYFLFPTPETLQSLIDQKGLPLVLNPNQSNYEPIRMPYDEFAGHVDNVQYPVGIADLGEYGHDLVPDHLPSILLGGRSYVELLRPIASARKTPDGSYSVWGAQSVDHFTSSTTQRLMKIGATIGSPSDDLSSLSEIAGEYNRMLVKSKAPSNPGVMEQTLRNGIQEIVNYTK